MFVALYNCPFEYSMNPHFVTILHPMQSSCPKTTRFFCKSSMYRTSVNVLSPPSRHESIDPDCPNTNWLATSYIPHKNCPSAKRYILWEQLLIRTHMGKNIQSLLANVPWILINHLWLKDKLFAMPSFTFFFPFEGLIIWLDMGVLLAVIAEVLYSAS